MTQFPSPTETIAKIWSKHCNFWSNKGYGLSWHFQGLQQSWINSAKTPCLSHCACKWCLRSALRSLKWIRTITVPVVAIFYSLIIDRKRMLTDVPSLWFITTLEWSAELRQVSEDLFHWYSSLATCWSEKTVSLHSFLDAVKHKCTHIQRESAQKMPTNKEQTKKD